MACNIFSCSFPCCIGQVRYVVAFMCLLAVLIAYCHRAVLNIAIVEMVKTKKGGGSTCPSRAKGSSTIANIGGGKVDWSEQVQQDLIMYFYPTYFLLHVPAGILCDKYGARHFMIWAYIVSSSCTALIPICAINFPWWTVLILRLITGGAQGIVFPAIGSLLNRWIPPAERATIGAMVFAANAFGTLVGNAGTGMVVAMMSDWRVAYYMWAVIGGAFVLLMFPYIFSDPRVSPFISDVEMGYLTEVMVFKQPMGIPLLPMLLDTCVWGLIAAQIGHGFLVFALANNLPKYFNNVLGFPMKANALMSFIFPLQWLSGFIFGNISDHLTKKKNANVSWMRKIYTSMSNIGAGILCVCAGLMECNAEGALIFFASALFLKGIFFAGMKVNILDISINHSALAMSVINGIGAVAGWGCGQVIKVVAKNNTHEQWRIVFLSFLGIQLVTSVLYCIMSGTDRRKWDYKEGEFPAPRKKPAHWYLQMSPSDNQIRLDKDAKALENRKINAAAAKEKMKATAKANEEAKKAAKAAKD